MDRGVQLTLKALRCSEYIALGTIIYFTTCVTSIEPEGVCNVSLAYNHPEYNG